MADETNQRAAAIATWIAIEVMERNPQHFQEREALQAFGEEAIHRSLDLAEAGRYVDATEVCRNFLGRILVEHKSLIVDDADLFDAIGALAAIDPTFNKA